MVSNQGEKAISVEVISDLNSIREEIGLTLESPQIFIENLDSLKDVGPILIKTPDNEYYLIGPEITVSDYLPGARVFDTINKPIKTIYYKLYFTWERSQEALKSSPTNHADALARALPVNRVKVSSDMALDKYREFQEQFHVALTPFAKRDIKILLYEVNKAGAISLYNKDRSSAEATAAALIDKVSTQKSEDKALIKESLPMSKSNRLAPLDALMKKGYVSCLLASSKIHIQGLTVLPWDEIKDGYLALYDGRQIFVLSPEPIEHPNLKRVNEYGNLREALDSLVGDATLGVEEKDLDIGRALEIGIDRIKNATNLFRAWQEETAHFDLPYYVIAGQVARWATEKTLAFVEEEIKAKKNLTEMDAEEKFYELVDELLTSYNPSLSWYKPSVGRKKAAIMHAGTRIISPSQATNYPLSAEMSSFKIDVGIELFHNGILHACSDIARTLVLTEEGKQFYNLLERNLLEHVIPAVKHGNTGADVYWAGISQLAKMEEKIKEWGMMPADVSLSDAFNRNIGHVLAKQNAVTLSFTKEETRKLQSGMVGSAEYVWAYRKHSLLVEDMYLVTDEKGINISR